MSTWDEDRKEFLNSKYLGALSIQVSAVRNLFEGSLGEPLCVALETAKNAMAQAVGLLLLEEHNERLAAERKGEGREP